MGFPAGEGQGHSKAHFVCPLSPPPCRPPAFVRCLLAGGGGGQREKGCCCPLLNSLRPPHPQKPDPDRQGGEPRAGWGGRGTTGDRRKAFVFARGRSFPPPHPHHCKEPSLVLCPSLACQPPCHPACLLPTSLATFRGATGDRPAVGTPRVVRTPKGAPTKGGQKPRLAGLLGKGGELAPGVPQSCKTVACKRTRLSEFAPPPRERDGFFLWVP